MDRRYFDLINRAPALRDEVRWGKLKRILKDSFRHVLPDAVANREDKMGFPVPLVDWINGDAKEFVFDVLSSKKALSRDLIDNRKVLEQLGGETKFGRTTWGLLCHPTQTKSDFGWKTMTPLATGVALTIDWCRMHGITQTFTHLKPGASETEKETAR